MENIFLNSFIILLILSLIVKVMLILLNRNHIDKHKSQVPANFEDFYSLEDHQKSVEYSKAKIDFTLFTLLLNTILTLFLVFWGFNHLDLYVYENISKDPLVQGLIYISLLSLFLYLVNIPESLYYTFKIEEKFGFNNTTLKLFIIDNLKSLFVTFLIGTPVVYGILLFMLKAGETWWVWAAAFFISIQFIMIWAYPKFIAPLFNRFTLLKSDELIDKLEALLQKTQIIFKDFYVMDASIRSSHGNAFFTGFGKNKRIVFFDTLIKNLAPDEIIAVLAHELGHFKHKHILKKLFFSVFFIFLGFYILGFLSSQEWFFKAFNVKQSNHMTLVLFVTISPVYTFFFTPIGSWFSRKDEFEADTFAVQNADGEQLITALIKLNKNSYSNLTPHPLYSNFYFSHPPTIERVAFIKSKLSVN
jgi:STE24 endopeptidase